MFLCPKYTNLNDSCLQFIQLSSKLSEPETLAPRMFQGEDALKPTDCTLISHTDSLPRTFEEGELALSVNP